MFDSPPWIIDDTEIDGETIRRALTSIIGNASGLVSSGDLLVTAQTVPNMSVQMAPGAVWVAGTSTPTQGSYYGRNNAPMTIPINAANPSEPRVDTIVAQVQDAAYAGTARQLGCPPPIVGTPTQGALLTNLNGVGAVPPSSYVLAYVLVPAGATSITTADILNVASPLGTIRQPGQLIFTAAPVTAMAGALPCLGAIYTEAAYPGLFAEIGTEFGPGNEDGVSGNLPNYADKFILGAGGAYPLGSSGGATELTLTVAQLPPHEHNEYPFTVDGATNGSPDYGEVYPQTSAWGIDANIDFVPPGGVKNWEGYVNPLGITDGGIGLEGEPVSLPLPPYGTANVFIKF